MSSHKRRTYRGVDPTSVWKVTLAGVFALLLVGCSNPDDGSGDSDAGPDVVADADIASDDGADLGDVDLRVSDVELESIPPRRVGRDDFTISVQVTNNGEAPAEQFTCEYSIQPTEPTEVGVVDGAFESLPAVLEVGASTTIEQEVHIIAESDTPSYNADYIVTCAAEGEPSAAIEDNSAQISSSVLIQ